MIMNKFVNYLGGLRLILLLITVLFFQCKKDDSGSYVYAVQKDDLIADTPNLKPEVAGYLPLYKWNKFDSINYSQLTQLFYFSLYPNPDGTLQIKDFTDRQINYIKPLIGNDITFFVTIGGVQNPEYFGLLASTKETRLTFVNTVVKFCLDYGFDGADIDWEFPASSIDRQNFTLLLKELSEELHKNDLLLSCALVANDYYIDDESFQYIDQINLMAYNNIGKHSTVSYSKECIKHFIDRGVSRDKIMLGVPFYGKVNDRWEYEHFASYEKICDSLVPKPEDDIAGDFYFNGINTIKEKTKLTMTSACKGIMIWEVTQDKHDSLSLLKVIDDAIKEGI